MNGLKFRFAKKEDRNKWLEWFSEKEILKWFPLKRKVEIEDAVRILESYIPQDAVLSVEMDGELCGVACIYLQSFKKLSHQALFVILIDQKFRGKKIGTALLKEVFKLAKEKHKLEMLHLEVYEGNRAISLYEKTGFKRFGYQRNFLKDNNEYVGKIFMQKDL